MSPRVQDQSHPCLLTEVEQRFRKLLFFFFQDGNHSFFCEARGRHWVSTHSKYVCTHSHDNHGEPVGPIRERAQGGEGAGWQRLVCSGLRCPVFLSLSRCPHHHSQSLWHSLWFSEAP